MDTILIICVLIEWFCANKHFLNFEKTHFILFVICKSAKNPVIKIENDVIVRVKVKKKLLYIYQ